MALDYDAVVIISGDGLVHEIFNEFAQHENSIAVLAIPLAPVQTGSGNGYSLSLLGLKVNYLFFGRVIFSASTLKQTRFYRTTLA
jgi:hypothetical protein